MDTLEFGTNEDKSWTIYINGFDLSTVTLKSQIRSVESQTLAGAFVATVLTPGSIKLSISKTVSGAMTPGDYIADVLATSTVDGLNTFVTPIFNVLVTDRVTEP